MHNVPTHDTINDNIVSREVFSTTTVVVILLKKADKLLQQEE